ncbi:MAG: hypothetical protein R2748_31650 [Bryobacterales bacterium]
MQDAKNSSRACSLTEQVCDCPDNPKVWISCNNTTCSNGYDKPRAYVRSRAVKSFSTLGVYPNVPSQVTIDMSAYLRVQ